MSHSHKILLYSYFRSSCSWRVRIALALKGIEYDTQPVHLLEGGGEQHGNDYKKINSMEQVPSLVIDGHVITQSVNILEYLEEQFPQSPLLPKDLLQRAKVREICEVIGSGIQPLQNLSVLQYLGDDRKLEWARHFITKGFSALEKILENSAGRYCVGNDVTLADCCLVPQVFNAFRFKVDIEKFPLICRLNKTLSELEAFQAAHPSQQPDCPPELK